MFYESTLKTISEDKISYPFLSLFSLKQIGLESAKFILTSTASLEYDTDQYIFYSSSSNNIPPVHKVIKHIFIFWSLKKSPQIDPRSVVS